MKKIIAGAALAALSAGLVFADEPASNPSVVEFTGNASVEFGVDLDAGKTGFKNAEDASFKMKLFNNGNKATAQDGDVWAELKIKVGDDDSVGPNGASKGTFKGKNAEVEEAKLHFGNVYVGIRKGDTQTGELDFTTAIRGADPWYHPGRWLKNVGPADYTQGIVAGYADNNFDFGVDFRSLEKGQYTNSYAVAAEAKLKDSNEFVNGLDAKVGGSYQLSDEYYESSKTNTKVDQKNKLGHVMGYSASVGYKAKIDDKFYVKPMVGITGSSLFADYDNSKSTGNSAEIVGSVIFGWGDTNSYGSTGLHYFDDDRARGMTPGISVLAKFPLPTVGTAETTVAGTTVKGKSTEHDAIQALIVPSFYLGDLIPNLKAAAYSEIGLYNGKKEAKNSGSVTDSTTETWGSALNPDDTFAFALAAGVAYDIKADAITITPKASIRFANAAYVSNKTYEKTRGYCGDNNKVDHDMFPAEADGLGVQKTKKVKDATGNEVDYYDGNFFNLKAGVDVAGLINNTTFYAFYQSANLLNKTEYNDDKYYNVKAGRITVGTKISF